MTLLHGFVFLSCLPLFFVAGDFDCETHTTCDTCLADVQCGWCASSSTCIAGDRDGPVYGTCSDWEFAECPSPPTPPPIQLGGDWPMYGGSWMHNGYRNIPMDEINKPKPVWRTSHGGPSTPSVLCNGVIVAVSVSGAAGGSPPRLSGLDAVTGERVFNISLNTTYEFFEAVASLSPPACRDNVAYIQTVGTSELYIFAVDLTTQTVQWNSSAPGSNFGTSFHFGVTPHPTNGLIYAPGGAVNGELLALNPSDGSLNFTFELYRRDPKSPNTGLECGGWTPSAYEKYDNEVFWATDAGDGDSSGLIGSTNALTGREIWNIKAGGMFGGWSTDSVFAIGNDMGLSRLNYGIYGVSLSKQAAVWNYTSCLTNNVPEGSFYDKSLATDGTVAAATCGSELTVFNLLTGEEEASYDCPNCGNQPIITPDYYIAPGLGVTYLFPRAANRPTVKIALSGALMISGNTLFVTNMQTGYVVPFLLEQ